MIKLSNGQYVIGVYDGYQVDGLHPAAAGYMLIARAWKERIVK